MTRDLNGRGDDKWSGGDVLLGSSSCCCRLPTFWPARRPLGVAGRHADGLEPLCPLQASERRGACGASSCSSGDGEEEGAAEGQAAGVLYNWLHFFPLVTLLLPCVFLQREGAEGGMSVCVCVCRGGRDPCIPFRTEDNKEVECTLVSFLVPYTRFIHARDGSCLPFTSSRYYHQHRSREHDGIPRIYFIYIYIYVCSVYSFRLHIPICSNISIQLAFNDHWCVFFLYTHTHTSIYSYLFTVFCYLCTMVKYHIPFLYSNSYSIPYLHIYI